VLYFDDLKKWYRFHIKIKKKDIVHRSFLDQDDKNFDKKKLPDILREVANNMDNLLQQK
jgi:hypothetical protein